MNGYWITCCCDAENDKRITAGKFISKCSVNFKVFVNDCVYYSERDILRLKINWLFVIIACIVRVINYMCVIPTNHQFIINPTAETLNITNEVNT